MEVVHQQGNHPVTARGAVVFPLGGSLRAASSPTLFVSFQYNRYAIPEETGDGVYDLLHLVPWVVIGWIDPFGYGLHIVAIALIETGGILLRRIERMLPGRKIFPLAVHPDRPSKLDQTRIDRRFRPGGEEILFIDLLEFGGNRGLPGLKGMGRTPVKNDAADDAGMGFGDEEGGARCHRFRINPDRIRVERKSPGRRFIEHEEKGGPEALIPVPLGMGGKVSPTGGPVADQFVVLCRGGCPGDGRSGRRSTGRHRGHRHNQRGSYGE